MKNSSYLKRTKGGRPAPLSLHVSSSDVSLLPIITEGADIPQIIREVPVKDILRDIRVERLINNRIEYGLNKRADYLIYKSGFAFGLLTALIHSQTLESMRRNHRNPLRCLCPTDLNVLLTAWAYLQVGNKVITAQNILMFSPTYKISGARALTALSEMGYIEQVDAVEIHRLTGKIPKPPKRGPMPKTYVINRTGHKLLEAYFELYEHEHKRLTGRMWSDHLVKLGPKKPKY